MNNLKQGLLDCYAIRSLSLACVADLRHLLSHRRSYQTSSYSQRSSRFAHCTSDSYYYSKDIFNLSARCRHHQTAQSRKQNSLAHSHASPAASNLGRIIRAHSGRPHPRLLDFDILRLTSCQVRLTSIPHACNRVHLFCIVTHAGRIRRCSSGPGLLACIAVKPFVRLHLPRLLRNPSNTSVCLLPTSSHSTLFQRFDVHSVR